MKTARLELRITEELLAQIDAARGDVSRTRWVERALEAALRPAELDSLGPSAAPHRVKAAAKASVDRTEAFRRMTQK